jgi:hypothetical protein
MRKIRSAFVLLSVLSLAACVTSPLSRTPAESSSGVILQGYAGVAGQSITIQAIDQNTGNPVTLGPATAAMTGTSYKASNGQTYTLYPWSYNAGVLAQNYWSPQSIVPDLATSQGHLEITATGGGTAFDTFSQAAADSAVASHQDPADAGNQYSDGKSTVLFDQTGVGYGAETPFVPLQGMISDSHVQGYSAVAWSVGYYTVENGKKIYALICAPTEGGPYPVVVYNHGGINASDAGNLTGSITTAGWTKQPANGADNLGQCLDWAKRGWIFATSSYRGESVNITSASSEFANFNKTSDGNPEFCMGEVTDVMALTDLLVNHASAIMLGGTGQNVPIKTNGKLFMYGYSHGGCITYRAVEQGAPVTAFSVIEGFTDLSFNYLEWRQAGFSVTTAEDNSGAYQPPGLGTPYLPDAAHVMGYNWRSAHYFASHGDLGIQKFKTMPILILHGDVDLGNPVWLAQPAEISADIGATNIYVGVNGSSPPTSEPCIAGPVGAPLPSTLTAPNATCPISFTAMNASNPSCLTPGPAPLYLLGLCSVVLLPQTPPAGQMPHYFVVYQNMNHTNGGLAIKETFNRFAELNFDRQPGCDGLELDCATD